MVGPLDLLRARLPAALPLDADLLDVYHGAVKIGRRLVATSPPGSFTVVMIALLVHDDALSKWYAEAARKLGPDLVKVLEEYQTSLDAVNDALREAADVTQSPQLLTVSSRTVLDNACAWAQQVGGHEVGIRHLLAAYLISPPPDHRSQLKRWGTDENAWAAALFDHLVPVFTSEQWQDARRRVAPAAHLSPVLKGDRITTDDLEWSSGELATRILRNAQRARDHAGTRGWLNTRLLLFALVECARINDDVRREIAPLWNLVEANHAAYDDAKQKARLTGWVATAADGAEVKDLALTPQLVNLLETARLLSRSARPPTVVGPLELVAAFGSRRVEADGELLACGIDAARLRQAVVDEISARGGAVDVWREAMDPEAMLYAARPVKLDSDEPDAVVRGDPDWKSDPLLRRPDVEAFGALLAARNLEPPLSIGLFGPWGSGKTTFLRRLRASVDRHAGSKSAEYVSHVVHVEFNAWHYAESDLVACLVDAVFRQIDSFVGGKPEDSGASWLQAEERKLESARQRGAAATAARTSALASAQTAQRRLEDATTAAREQQSAVTTAMSAAWETTKAAVKHDPVVVNTGILAAIGDFTGGLTALRERLAALRRPDRMLASISWGTWLVIAVAIIALPLAAAAAVGAVLGGDALTRGLTVVTSLLAVAAGAMRRLAGAAARVDEAGATVEARFAAAIEQSPDVRTAREALDKARAALQSAESLVAETSAEVVRAEAAVAEASLPAQVARLAAARIADQTYAKSLGLVSTARADFSVLSKWLREQTTQPDNNAPRRDNPPPKHVDRVILYIDDLDRCSPDQVVKVLQLVHMLLAFELFVVVVGVDANWIRHALQHSIAGIAGPGHEDIEGAPTPQEYLEKIFQVAFWLEPMNPTRVASYIASLVRKPGASVPAARWELDTLELDFLRALSAQIATSPRRAKRLVNVYRLIKARLSDAQLETFLTRSDRTSGPYQIALALLVIGVTAAGLGPAILDDLASSADAALSDVISRYRERGPAWCTAADVLDTLHTTQPRMPFTELRGWALHIARYLLHPRQDTANLGARGAASIILHD